MYQQKDELTKNHREDSEAQEGGLMYEIPGSATCPVLSMEKYIAKLNPNNPAFFQRPRELANPEDPTWYCNQVVGINMLGNKMKNLSRDAKLSKEYTNHSVRATSVTILDYAGFQARQLWLLVVTKVNRVSAVMLVKLATMSSVQCQIPLAMLCILRTSNRHRTSNCHRHLLYIQIGQCLPVN